jgi:hypothetical protein
LVNMTIEPRVQVSEPWLLPLFCFSLKADYEIAVRSLYRT